MPVQGGPLAPHSITFPSADVGPGVHTGATNSRRFEGIKCIASLASDRVVRLLFPMPPTTLPTGTLKLVMQSMSVATSGNAILNPAWFSETPNTDTPDDSTLTAEGAQTITWAAGDDDELKETKVTLDASTAPAAGDVLHLQITFTTSSWTLASTSVWWFFLIWE